MRTPKFLVLAMVLFGSAPIIAQEALDLRGVYIGKFKCKVDPDATTDDDYYNLKTDYIEVHLMDSGRYYVSHSWDEFEGTYYVDGNRLMMMEDEVVVEDIVVVREGDTIIFNPSDYWEEVDQYLIYRGPAEDTPPLNRVCDIQGSFEVELSGNSLRMKKETSDGWARLKLRASKNE